MKATPEQIQDGVNTGKITPAEAAYYTEARYHKPRRQRTIASVIAIVIILTIILSTTPLNPGNNALSGNIVLDTTPLQNGNTMTIDTPVTRITTSGTLTGEGNATLWFDATDGTSLRVATITSDDGTPRTDKASYNTGETVIIQHAPADATYYLDDGTDSTAVILPFAAPENDATLLVVTTTQEGIVTYRIPIRIGAQERETGFDNLCIDTCAMQATAGTLRVETSEGVTLDIDEINADVQSANHPPTLIQPLPALSITDTTTLDLAPFFNDVDDDTILYSTGASNIATLTIDGSTLTITPTADGNETIFVYASDLKELIPTPLDLTVVMPTIETPATNDTNTTNETATNETTTNNPPANTNGTNTTIDTQTNETINTTTNITAETTTNTTTNETNNTTLNTSLDCSDPDPNKRPLDCLNIEAEKYFEETILLTDIDRNVVGKVTLIGNLLITGRAIEQSVDTPGTRDFTITYRDEDFNTIPTIWIDSDTGNLHLRGRLHELNTNIDPPTGSYAVMNRRGVYLLYATPKTGDLYLRGNIIPYRTSVSE